MTQPVAKKIERILAKPIKEGAVPAALIGPGVVQVLAAQAMLRRLGERPPHSPGVEARVRYIWELARKTGGGTSVVLTPAVFSSPANLRAPVKMFDRLTRTEASLWQTIEEARRRISSLESMIARLADSSPNQEALIQARMLVAETERVDTRTKEHTESEGDSSEASTSTTGTDDEPDVLARIQNRTEAMLDTEAPTGSALHVSEFKVPEAAIHDFTQYVFLRDPDLLVGTGERDDPVASDLEAFLRQALDIIRSVIECYCNRETETNTYKVVNFVPLFPKFISTIYRLFVTYAASELYEFSKRVVPGYSGFSGSVRTDLLNAFRSWLVILVRNADFDPESLDQSFDSPTLWTHAAAQVEQLFKSAHPDAAISNQVGQVSPNYSFTPFPLDVVNFGLRIVYRQQWRPLGTQPGEIVRTIPLGPKQVEKVTTRVLISQRESRTAETFLSTESSTEASNVTKESSDVVEEASSSLKWHVEAEASGGFLGISASAGGGRESASASSSKETKSRLNETMEKTASRMRRDIKVVVSTERAVSEEMVRGSEITNPNDEVAVTYVYSRLQRQYEIQTTMAEVNSVVFVPERVPEYDEITPEWIRRYDWILAKALLDPSFAEDLTAVSRETDDPPLADSQGIIEASAAKVRDAISEYKAFTGGALPDLFSTIQAGYERQLEKKQAIAQNSARRSQRTARLIDHIRQNILHYMRAIWSAEDADQRLRRYARILVPTRWTFVPSGATPASQPEIEVEGQFLPDFSPESIGRLSDIINPAGPLGYGGNYAIFYLRSDPRLVELNGALSALRLDYVRFAVTVEGSDTRLRQAFAGAPWRRVATYSLKRTGAGNWSAWLPDLQCRTVVVSSRLNDTEVEFEGIVVRFDSAPGIDQVMTVRIRCTDELEDPEIRVLERENPLPPASEELTFFTDWLLRDMATYLPEVVEVLPADLSGGWANLSAESKETVRAGYHHYLLLREHTRRFLMETNNLVLDLEVGRTPSLEEFKRLHRAVDVLKELEEAGRRHLENARRMRRLEKGELGDADIENVTVVGSASELRTVVGPVVNTGTPETGVGKENQ